MRDDLFSIIAAEALTNSLRADKLIVGLNAKEHKRCLKTVTAMLHGTFNNDANTPILFIIIT